MFTAYDVAKPRTVQEDAGEYPFGVGPAQFAAELRKLADAVDNNRVALQKVSILSVAHHDDFPMTYVRFKLFEKQNQKSLT
jgi:hypothetical protein